MECFKCAYNVIIMGQVSPKGTMTLLDSNPKHKKHTT